MMAESSDKSSHYNQGWEHVDEVKSGNIQSSDASVEAVLEGEQHGHVDPHALPECEW